jgi:GT2 family glycosyltransferase
MHLFVVLVNWRNTTRTVACATALRRWDALQPTIVIVDNESTEASRQALEAAGVADRVVASPVNRGYGGGNNLGIAEAARDADTAILLLNSDVEVSEATASKLLARLEADRTLSIVGPLLRETSGGGERLYAGGRDIGRYPRTRIDVDAARLAALPGHPLIPVDYVPGTVLMARGSLFADVGMLDEEYFFSGEIADLCKRAEARGHKLRIDLQCEAQHEAAGADGAPRDTLYAYYSLRNRFLYVRRHHAAQKLRYFGFWAMIAARGAVAAIVRGRPARARAILLATAHGLMGRYGNQNAAFI